MIQSKCLDNAFSKESINTGDVFANVQEVIFSLFLFSQVFIKKKKFLLIKTSAHNFFLLFKCTQMRIGSDCKSAQIKIGKCDR